MELTIAHLIYPFAVVASFALGLLCGKPKSPVSSVERPPKKPVWKEPPVKEVLNPIFLDDRHEDGISKIRDEED